jgi:hypothetical protein
MNHLRDLKGGLEANPKIMNERNVDDVTSVGSL